MPGPRLTFAAADLENDEGWDAAVDGVDYVQHIASPFPAGVPKDENDLIRPAREGALRVLRAAKKAGVKRVVLTSSFAAIGYGQKAQDKPFDESNWTDPSGEGVSPYVKSKTLAERAAWDFVNGEGAGLELSVVNPVGVFGPVLGRDYSTSILPVQRLMDGAMPGLPRMPAPMMKTIATRRVISMPSIRSCSISRANPDSSAVLARSPSDA